MWKKHYRSRWLPTTVCVCVFCVQQKKETQRIWNNLRCSKRVFVLESTISLDAREIHKTILNIVKSDYCFLPAPLPTLWYRRNLQLFSFGGQSSTWCLCRGVLKPWRASCEKTFRCSQTHTHYLWQSLCAWRNSCVTFIQLKETKKTKSSMKQKPFRTAHTLLSIQHDSSNRSHSH